MKWLLFCCLMLLATSLKMLLTFEPQQTRCFYQMLMAQQKYAVELSPTTQGKYQLFIKHRTNQTWQHSVHRRTSKDYHNVTLYKLAKHQSLYSYCIRNLERDSLKLRTEIRWGLQLLDLKVIAEEDDQKNIENEAKWIEKQATKIQQVVKSTYIKRRDRDEYANLMRKKLIGYAIIGLLVMLGISICFYITIRKTFRDRKMI